MELTAVAAVAENGVIGDADGEIPWPSIPMDREQYRAHVAGHPVILGRKTFESMLDDLPGNHQIVLTSNPAMIREDDAVSPVSSATNAIDRARTLAGSSAAFVLGGGAVYESMLPSCDRLRISRVQGSFQGSVMFPPIDERKWYLEKTVPATEITLEIWERDTSLSV